MKGRLYTMLKIKKDYGLSYIEKVLWWMVEDVTIEEYLRSLIELRDTGHIYEDNVGNSLAYRNHYLTEKGYQYLPKLKRLYLRNLWIKNRVKIIAWMIPVLLTIVFGLIGSLKN